MSLKVLKTVHTCKVADIWNVQFQYAQKQKFASVVSLKIAYKAVQLTVLRGLWILSMEYLELQFAIYNFSYFEVRSRGEVQENFAFYSGLCWLSSNLSIGLLEIFSTFLWMALYFDD